MYPPQQVYPWQQPQDELQPPPSQVQAPAWDRSAFRDQWMQSGVRDVPGMQRWLQETGWGQHVGTGGSKGDKAYLPGGEAMDLVLGAGLGGNIGGPQWTGAGNWMQEGRVPYQGGGIGPSQNFQMPNWGQMQPQGMWSGWMQQHRNLNPAAQQNQMHRMWQGQQQQRMQPQRGMQTQYGMNQGMRPQNPWNMGGNVPSVNRQRQPQMKQPQYTQQNQQNRMYY